MNSHQEALTTAVALTVGMRIDAYAYTWAEVNGMGGVELYHEIGQLAALSYDLMMRVATSPDFAYTEFPGVYAYEVEERLGNWLGAAMGNGTLPAGPEEPGHLMTEPVLRKLGHLASEFFHRSPNHLEHTDGIIARMTGYERGVAA